MDTTITIVCIQRVKRMLHVRYLNYYMLVATRRNTMVNSNYYSDGRPWYNHGNSCSIILICGVFSYRPGVFLLYLVNTFNIIARRVNSFKTRLLFGVVCL